ncbi:hypothetical protein V2J09_013269 [Rumex salicifolius]
MALICVLLCSIYWITKAICPRKKLSIRLPTTLQAVNKPKGVGSKTIQVWGLPLSMSAKEATQFLEEYTGEKSVYFLKLRHSVSTSKASGRRGGCAMVQFTSGKDAERVLMLARKRGLQCGSEYLEAHPMERDVVLKPMTCEHSIQDVTLHFGCQIEASKFVVLWSSGQDLTLSFGFSQRKLYFFLPYQLRVYKLELSYDSIWQIQLRRPPLTQTKFLLIQMSGRPYVYEKSDSIEEFKDTFVQSAQDDDWIRTVDFTPSRCIGQSPVLCIELPHNRQLPDLRGNFPQLKDHRTKLTLESGTTFSQPDSDLVPIVDAPKGLEVPFDILFMVNILVQNGYLPGPSLDFNFFQKIDTRQTDKSCIEFALHRLYTKKKCLYDPVSLLEEQYNQYQTSKRPPKQPFISLDSGLGLVYIRRVQVTPCRVIFCGPEALVSNRVVRHFSDDINSFIRVSFVDEDFERVHSTDLCPYRGQRTGVDTRIRSVLGQGICIGGKKFEFLAFSNSQLKENSTWMFASGPKLCAADIRKWMGDFSEIRNVAKYAARLGQSLSSSTETLRVTKNEMQVIDDVEIETSDGSRKGRRYCFSDGIGKISAQFAAQVSKKCKIRGHPPSAFQIRYAGFKGVVAVDPSMPSTIKLSLRNSMCKYESENDKLDVLAYSKYQACFLNRQIITLLSTLGVKDEAFERKQEEATRQLDAILTDSNKALEALRMLTSGEVTNVLKEMISSGYKPDTEPFLSKMVQTLLASKLQELRTRTRIFIPDGRAMMGCLDETATLEYGQVFVQLSNSKYRDVMMSKEMLTPSYSTHRSPTYVVEAKVLVAKNPCLHPGDVRILTAVNMPALRHMVDCIVFPQKGPRPHPDECSGSDLDGDVYFVCWDPDLIPPLQIEPMDYSPSNATILDHDVTIEEVQDYFVNHIINNNLGMIANAHTVFADKDHEKAMSEPCLKLAKLFSVAVDFPKTGVPAEIPQELRVKEYPDFMEKPEKPTYESKNVIGKLFREVKHRVPESIMVPFTKDIATRCYDPCMEYQGFREYLEDAFYNKVDYDSRLASLMDYYGIRSEGEILSGSIVRMSKRKDVDAVPLAIKSLRNEARGWFNEDNNKLNKYAKASAWYHVTYHPNYWGKYNEGTSREHFLSFPWCVHDILLKMKRSKTGVSTH